MYRNQYQIEISSPLVSGENSQIVQNTGNFGSLQVLPPVVFPTSSPNGLAFRRSQNKKLSQIAQKFKDMINQKLEEGEESPTTLKLKSFQNKYSNSINWLDRVQEIEDQEEENKRQQKMKEKWSQDQPAQKTVVNSLLAKRATLLGKKSLKLSAINSGKKSESQMS